MPWPLDLLVAYVTGQWVFYPMVRWGFTRLNAEKIDNLLDEKQKNYLKVWDKKEKLNKESTDDEIKFTAKELADAILALHNNRKPDGLLSLD